MPVKYRGDATIYGEQAALPTPLPGEMAIGLKTDGVLYSRNPSGAEIPLGGFQEAVLTTTGSTPQTLLSIPVAAGTVVTLIAFVTASISDYTAGASRRLVATAQRALTGNAASVGIDHGALLENSPGAPDIVTDVDVTTNAIRIRVTGIAAETWAWRVIYRVVRS